METSLLEIVKQYGIQAAIIVFFVWRDWQREKEMAAKITEVEKFVRDTLLTALRESTAAIAAQVETAKLLLAALKDCPCSEDEIKEIKQVSGR